MDEQHTHGDNISIGNISNSQGVAIGRNASAIASGQNVSGHITVDAEQLRIALATLYDAVGESQLPREQVRVAQTAAGKALEGVQDNEVNADTVVQNVRKIGETLTQANVAVKEGSILWESVQKLASLLGPLVGGARVVAAWFGILL
jgi:uncharacterized protein (UPF0147 family)